jgi:hypothetical protein
MGKRYLEIKPHFAGCRHDAAREVKILRVEANFDPAQPVAGGQLSADPAQEFSTGLEHKVRVQAHGNRVLGPGGHQAAVPQDWTWP